MNPFSGFLQMPAVRPIDSGVSFADLGRMKFARQQEENRVREAGLDNARADQYLKLQQQDQANRFGQQENKQVEALLAEYQDAEDQGDPVRLSRAAQALKRFGMDVSQPQAGTKVTAANIQALTGQLPFINPIDEAVQTELKSREALKARNVQPETDLSQEDFEEQLINSTQAASGRYEQGGKTTEEFRNQLPQAPDDSPVDMGDVDSPEFKAAAAQEAVDLGDVDSPEFQAAAAREARPELKNTERLSPPPGQMLPTIVSRGGKQLYQSTGPSGRWAPMVSGAFEPLLANENPEIASAAQRAQQIATKLIQVDGVAPKEAIGIGMDYLKGEAARLTGLERTKLGSRKSGGGGGGQSFDLKSRRAFSNEMRQTMKTFRTEEIEKGLRGYDGAIVGLDSSNPASQHDAINRLVAARSGLTVSDRERQIYERLAGLWQQVNKRVNMLAGEALPEEYKNQLRQLMSEARGALIEEREKRAKAAQRFYESSMRGAAAPEEIAADAAAVADGVRMGGAAGQASDDEEALY